MAVKKIDLLPRDRICPLLGKKCIGEQCAFSFILVYGCPDGEEIEFLVCLVKLGLISSYGIVDYDEYCEERKQ